MFTLKDRRARRAGIGCEALEGRQLLSLATDLRALASETKSIHVGSGVTSTEVKAVASDLAAIAKVATRPSASSVSALKTEVQTIVAHGPITPAEAVILEGDVDAVLTSANIPSTLAQQTASDLEAVLTSSKITPTEAKAELADVKAVLIDLGSASR